MMMMELFDCLLQSTMTAAHTMMYHIDSQKSLDWTILDSNE